MRKTPTQKPTDPTKEPAIAASSETPESAAAATRTSQADTESTEISEDSDEEGSSTPPIEVLSSEADSDSVLFFDAGPADPSLSSIIAAERSASSTKKYSLLKKDERLLSDQHATKIAQLYSSDLQVPSRDLIKTAPAYKLNLSGFNPNAYEFIALVHFYAANKALPDLVAILKVFFEKNSAYKYQVLAILARTLSTKDYIAVFLEFTPSCDEFKPEVGLCRGSHIDAFFPTPLTEGLAQKFLDSLCDKAYSLVKETFPKKEKSAVVEKEKTKLVPEKVKKASPLRKLLKELFLLVKWVIELKTSRKKARTKTEPTELPIPPNSPLFTEKLINPFIQYLCEITDLIPPEIKLFLYESGCYLTEFNRSDVDVVQQLCGVFYLKFIFQELVQPSRIASAKLSVPQAAAIKVMTKILQRLTTKEKDKRLYDLVNSIASDEIALTQPYPPYAGSSHEQSAYFAQLGTLADDYLKKPELCLKESYVDELLRIQAELVSAQARHGVGDPGSSCGESDGEHVRLLSPADAAREFAEQTPRAGDPPPLSARGGLATAAATETDALLPLEKTTSSYCPCVPEWWTRWHSLAMGIGGAITAAGGAVGAVEGVMNTNSTFIQTVGVAGAVAVGSGGGLLIMAGILGASLLVAHCSSSDDEFTNKNNATRSQGLFNPGLRAPLQTGETPVVVEQATL